MTPTPEANSYVWGVAWASAIGAAQVAMWGLGAGQIPQFIIQYALVTAALILPGMLAMTLGPRRRPRIPMRWQVVVVLLIASTLAAGPWNSLAPE